MGTTRRGLLPGPRDERRPAPTATAHLPSQCQQSWPQPGGAGRGSAGRFSGSEVPGPPSKPVTCGAGGHAPRPQGLRPAAIGETPPQSRAQAPRRAARGMSRCWCSGSCSAPRSSPKGAALGLRGGREGARGQPPSAAPAGRVGTGNGQGDPRARAATGSVRGRSKACTC